MNSVSLLYQYNIMSDFLLAKLPPFLSMNNLIFNRFFPYVNEPNASSQVWLSNGHFWIASLQFTLNVAGPLQTHFPLLSTATSVTNLLSPPAKLTSSSPLKNYLECMLTLFKSNKFKLV